jgi:surface polysaccharide O-acyltransferase-like enzyme
MILYVFLSLLHKKINARIMEIKFIVAVCIVMFVYTLVCRIGFGSSVPLEPSWSYKINRDLTSHYWGLFGLFPEVLYIPLLCLDRVIDFIFWFFLRLGM